MIAYPELVEGTVRRYLADRLAAAGDPVPVLAETPNPRPADERHITLVRAETAMRHRFAQDVLFVLVCHDLDARRCDRTAQRCLALLLAIPASGLAQWAEHQSGPTPADDPELPRVAAIKVSVSITFPATTA